MPMKPYLREIIPDAIFVINRDTKKGLNRGSKPDATYSFTSFSNVSIPPWPDPQITPTSKGDDNVLRSKPESLIASAAAINAYWVKISDRLISFLSKYSSGL